MCIRDPPGSASSTWEEDERNVVLSSCYFTERNDEVCASPYLNVKIKKEQDTDLLNAYVEQYKLRYGDYKTLITLMSYIRTRSVWSFFAQMHLH